MNFPLSKNALDAMNAAPGCARQLGHDSIACAHILLSILALPKCGACKRLQTMNLSPETLSETMRQMISGASSMLMQRGQLPLTARTRKVLEIAAHIAGVGNPIKTENLVEAMLAEGENEAAQMLFNAGVTLSKFRSAGTQESAQEKKTDEEAAVDEDGEEDEGESESGEDAEGKGAKKTPTIDTFGRDLSDLARQGKIDPVIGRTKELKRVIQILSRRTKNNAVLIGEAGVGKTAIVEGLALAIHRGEVPERMVNKRIVALDMARVVAGTQYRGQFEERLKRIVDETQRDGNIVLFLDEIHTMVGAGGAEGAMDAANILKPALARGELQCVGATTLKEYHKSIEKDAALERRFQSIIVEEPTVADAIEILTGIALKYEEYHSVKFTPEAIRAAVELTVRYLPARQLPDKAIDALDETGARLRMAASARPKALRARQEKIDALRGLKSEAIKAGDFDEAAKLRDEIGKTAEVFQSELKEWKKDNIEQIIEVGEDAIAQTVSAVSGVPVEKMNATTADKLLGMEKALSQAVIGQDEAISAIARALRRSRAFLADPKRPIGSFLFLGPTGVGKTHLAKMLAEKVYGDDNALIVLDMSEFQEKYSSSRLVGAPPGYVGYDEGGQLTEKVRRRPYSVILFDEFEKADSDVMNMLLQILDDGRLTDGQGRKVDFRNTIIICTANLGFDFSGHRALGFGGVSDLDDHEQMKERLMGEAKRAFRPELLNRFDATVVFHKLGKEQMRQILELEVERLLNRLGDLHITLTMDEDAKNFLAEKGYDPAMGARPLRRVVQDYIEDPLADLVLAGKVKAKMRLRLDKDGKKLKFS